MPRTKKTTEKKVAPRKSVRSSKKMSTEVAMSVTSYQTQTSFKSYLKNPRLWVGVAVIIVAAVLYFYKGLFIAATVNGQPIARLSVVSQLEKQSGKQALNNLIIESLVRQEAQKRHITVSQSDVNAQITKIEGQLKGQGVTLDDALAAQGLSRGDLTDQLELQAMLNKMVGTSVKVSDADIQKYIDTNKNSLPTDLTDDQLKAQVKTQLEQQELQTKTQSFIADLQKSAKISYFVSY